MKFRDFAESLLGSKVKVKLIRLFVTQEDFFSERDMASMIGVSHNAVNKTLKEFHDLNFVSPMRFGSNLIWQLNKQSYAYEFLLGLKLNRTPLDDLKDYLKKIIIDMCHVIRLREDKIKKVVIFGSVAEGRELPNSDIDLFILVEDEKTKEEINRNFTNLPNYLLARYGNKLSSIIMSEKEYSKFKNKKLLENINKGIVVIDR